MIDGTGNLARFKEPKYIAVAPDGIVYVTDGQYVRAVTPSGVVTTLGEVGTKTINGIAISHEGIIYVSATDKIYEIAPDGSIHKVIYPSDGIDVRNITTDKEGNILALSGAGIKKLSPDGSVLTFISGGEDR